jgi:hypothetical protein
VSAGGARRGRRDNGLTAAEYAAAGDVDPRVGEHLLDVLAAGGIAAYLQPASDLNPITRTTTVPARPTDRLYVDRTHLSTARDYVARLAAEEEQAGRGGRTPDIEAEWARIVAGFHTEVDPATRPWPAAEHLGPDTDPGTGPNAGTDPPADRRRGRAGGQGTARPGVDGDGTAGTLGPPDPSRQPDPSSQPGPSGQLGPAGHADPTSAGSDRLAWRDPTVGPEPAGRAGTADRAPEWPRRGERAEPTGGRADPAGDGPRPVERRRRRSSDTPDEPSLLDALDTFGTGLPDEPSDDEGYTPPPPPPLPSFSKYAVAAVLAVAAGFVLFLFPHLLPLDPDVVMLFGFTCILAGFITLVWRLRPGDEEDDEDDPENGAVV